MPLGREHEYDPRCDGECIALVEVRGAVNMQKKTLDDLVHDLKGNGNPGFLRESVVFQNEARQFFIAHETREAERKKQLNLRDQEIKDALAKHYASVAADNAALSNKIGKRNLWVAVASLFVALAGLAVMAAGVAVTLYVAHHSSVDTLRIFDESATPAIASTQDAGLPYGVTLEVY